MLICTYTTHEFALKSYTIKLKWTSVCIVEEMVPAGSNIASACWFVNIKHHLLYWWKKIVWGESNSHLNKLWITWPLQPLLHLHSTKHPCWHRTDTSYHYSSDINMTLVETGDMSSTGAVPPSVMHPWLLHKCITWSFLDTTPWQREYSWN